MRQIITSLLLLLMFLPDMTHGQSMSVPDAQNIALNFWKVNTPGYNPHSALTATLKLTQSETDGSITFYVFNISPGPGFVIVAASNAVTPILAYSTESDFPDVTANTNLQYWIRHTSAQLQQVMQLHAQGSSTVKALWSAYKLGYKPASTRSSAVLPMLSTKWAQYPYYNAKCPLNLQDNKPTVAGCVAVAMAQIMKYWNYPPYGAGSYTYTDSICVNDTETMSVNFNQADYDWTNYPNMLDDSGEDNGLANTIYQCGVSVGMQYGDLNQGGSGAFVLQGDAGAGKPCSEAAFKKYFLYNPDSLKGVRQSDYNVNTWVALLENELTNGRPVEYEGLDTSYGAHDWVCDGFNSSNMLHMNWGFGGTGNGYYTIGNFDPERPYNFYLDNAALIGIEPAIVLHVSASASSQAICGGGGIDTLAAFGPANATYSWFPDTGLGCDTCRVTTVTGPCNTNYMVTVDSAGFTASASVSVMQSPPLGFQMHDSTANATCFGDSNGIASVSVMGGTPPFSFQWNTGQVSGSGSLYSVPAGTYNVTITDVNKCTLTGQRTVTQPSQIKVSIDSTAGTCSQSNGKLSASATGGTPGPGFTYTYNWSNHQAGSSLSNLAPGIYVVTVTDANFCTVSASSTIINNGTFTANVIATSATCFGYANGTLLAQVTNAVNPVTYVWSTGATTSQLRNLSSAIYQVTITDSTGCRVVQADTIHQPAKLVAALTPVSASCGRLNGSILAMVSGGTPQYNYYWNTGSNDSLIINLSPATYTLTVTDTNSCVAITSATITTSDNLNTSISSYPATCYGSSNGRISITVTGGLSPLSYTWSNGDSSAQLSGLSAGSYAVTVVDDGGCSAIVSIGVTQPDSLSIQFNPQNSTCGIAAASISASASGGGGTYTYLWPNGTTAAYIDSLPTGNYALTVSDQNHCQTVDSVHVSSNGALNISYRPVAVTCFGDSDGSVAVTAANGTPPYYYAWSTGTGGMNDSILRSLPAGVYNVSMSDIRNCQGNTMLSISQPDTIQVSLFIKNATSANDNGVISITNISGGTGPYRILWSNGDSVPIITNLAAGAYQVTISDHNKCIDTLSARVGIITGISPTDSTFSFTVYPNPSGKTLWLQLGQFEEGTTASLVNELGQDMLQQTITDLHTALNVSSLAGGIYLLCLKHNNDIALRQIVISH